MFRASFPWRLETASLREKLHNHYPHRFHCAGDLEMRIGQALLVGAGS